MKLNLIGLLAAFLCFFMGLKYSFTVLTSVCCLRSVKRF
jgi:hypothetical protein